MPYKKCRMTEDKEGMFNTEKIMKILDMEEEVHREVINKEDRVKGVTRVMVEVGMEVLQEHLSTDNNFHEKRLILNKVLGI
jgi:hypothetical protein